jgi:hypothetical protein
MTLIVLKIARKMLKINAVKQGNNQFNELFLEDTIKLGTPDKPREVGLRDFLLT